MKKHYLIGLVIVVMAGIVAVYAVKIGVVPGKAVPQPVQQTQSSSGQQRHDAAQNAQKAQEASRRRPRLLRYRLTSSR